jgi:hypothetical protein
MCTVPVLRTTHKMYIVVCTGHMYVCHVCSQVVCVYTGTTAVVHVFYVYTHVHIHVVCVHVCMYVCGVVPYHASSSSSSPSDEFPLSSSSSSTSSST